MQALLDRAPDLGAKKVLHYWRSPARPRFNPE